MNTAMTSISSSDYLLCTMLASREMSDEPKKAQDPYRYSSRYQGMWHRRFIVERATEKPTPYDI